MNVSRRRTVHAYYLNLCVAIASLPPRPTSQIPLGITRAFDGRPEKTTLGSDPWSECIRHQRVVRGRSRRDSRVSRINRNRGHGATLLGRMSPRMKTEKYRWNATLKVLAFLPEPGFDGFYHSTACYAFRSPDMTCDTTQTDSGMSGTGSCSVVYPRTF